MPSFGNDQQASMGNNNIVMPPAQQPTSLQPMNFGGQQGAAPQASTAMGGANNMIQALMGGYNKSLGAQGAQQGQNMAGSFASGAPALATGNVGQWQSPDAMTPNDKATQALFQMDSSAGGFNPYGNGLY